MIEVTFNHFFAIYLTITIVAILLIWLMGHSQKKNKIIFTTEKELQHCEFCHYSYVENSSDSLSRCPQCHLYNKHHSS
ncbi:MAG: hypothetical protein Q8K60_03625 [Parachlamydiaceae bacterium]|nr:hypothetical protein [Parachlamydiaceae bacterium]